MKNDNDNNLPRTRAEAKESGSLRYFTGKPCRNGHTSPRNTSNQICVTCDIEWRLKNRESLLSSKRERYQANRDRELAYARRYRAENPELVRAASKRWKDRNPEKVKSDWANWYTAKGKDRDAKIRATPRGRIDHAMSHGISTSLKDGKRGRRWESLVGYDLNQLMRHLEKLFQPGMTFENYGKGGWHIDHKIPKSAHNYTEPEHQDFKRCWALKNLQPLWEKENLSKQAKLESPFQPSLAIH